MLRQHTMFDPIHPLTQRQPLLRKLAQEPTLTTPDTLRFFLAEQMRGIEVPELHRALLQTRRLLQASIFLTDLLRMFYHLLPAGNQPRRPTGKALLTEPQHVLVTYPFNDLLALLTQIERTLQQRLRDIVANTQILQRFLMRTILHRVPCADAQQRGHPIGHISAQGIERHTIRRHATPDTLEGRKMGRHKTNQHGRLYL